MAEEEEDSNWFLSLVIEQEAGEQLVGQLMDDILQRSQDVLFEKHIESQVLPYAVDFAKSTLVQMIEWEFFRRDEGNTEQELWLPDKEPLPVTTDAWGRGCVPVQIPILSSTEMLNDEENVDIPVETTRKSMVTSSKTRSTTAVQSAAPSTSPRKSIRSTSTKSIHPMLTSTSPSRTLSRRTVAPARDPNTLLAAALPKPPSHLLPNPLRASLDPHLTEDNARLFEKIHKLEKEGSSSVQYTYDADGKIVFIRKWVGHKQPLQSIKTKIVPQGVNGTTTTMTNNATAGQGSSQHGSVEQVTSPQSTKKKPSWMKNTLPVSNNATTTPRKVPLAAIPTTERIHKVVTTGQNPVPQVAFVQDMSLDLPNTVDHIKLVPGVTYREGEVLRRGNPPPRPDLMDYNLNNTSIPRVPSLSQLVQSVPPTARAAAIESGGIGGPAPVDALLAHVLDHARPQVKPIPVSQKLNTQT